AIATRQAMPGREPASGRVGGAARTVFHQVRPSPIVIPGLDPGIHVDGRDKPGHDVEGGNSTWTNCAPDLAGLAFPPSPARLGADDTGESGRCARSNRSPAPASGTAA